MKEKPRIIIEKLKNTMTKKSIDFEKIIEDLGQVSAADMRSKGCPFSLDDHVRGMILSLLSNQRRWEPIARNMDNLKEIFFNYNPEQLEKADPQELVSQIKAIKCGNRAINNQMKDLKHNIKQLKRIEKDYGSLDEFLDDIQPEEAAKMLYDPNSPYKLKRMGPALAMEYLKNVGISEMKPDVHIMRICGPERLGLFSSNKLEEIAETFRELSKETNLSMTYLDNLFWIFGANEYGEICSSTPKCVECDCELRSYCHFNSL